MDWLLPGFQEALTEAGLELVAQLHTTSFVDEGWAGFGNRIHRADFKRIAQIGPPLRLESKELRTRVGPKRIVMKMEFHFWQEDALVYYGEQSAMFLKDTALDASD